MQHQMDKKNITIIIGVVIVLAVVLGAGIYLLVKQAPKASEKQTETPKKQTEAPEKQTEDSKISNYWYKQIRYYTNT